MLGSRHFGSSALGDHPEATNSQNKQHPFQRRVSKASDVGLKTTRPSIVNNVMSSTTTEAGLHLRQQVVSQRKTILVFGIQPRHNL